MARLGRDPVRAIVAYKRGTATAEPGTTLALVVADAAVGVQYNRAVIAFSTDYSLCEVEYNSIVRALSLCSISTQQFRIDSILNRQTGF